VQHSVDPALKIPDGRVDVVGPVGDVTISTCGPISVSDTLGRVTAVTSNSPILLQNLHGDIVARTTSMWIKAYTVSLTAAVDLETTNAPIETRLAAALDGSLKVVTSNSSIRVELPAGSSVDVSVTGAHCEGPIALTPVNIPGEVERYHGVSNGGKVPLDLRTSGGGMVYLENK
jgi:hypothetical protein